MTGKGRAYRWLLPVIAALALAGCSAPMGGLGVGTLGSVATGNLVVTGKYGPYEVFHRPFLVNEEHLEVFHSDGSTPIPLADCNVFIEDPSAGGRTPVTERGYWFTTRGTKYIRVEHKDNSLWGRCPIEVLDSSVNGGINSTPGIVIDGPY